MVELLLALHGLGEDQATSFMARLKQLQRLGLAGLESVGRGHTVSFDPDQILRMAMIFEVASTGLAMADAGRLIGEAWPAILRTLKAREVTRREGVPIFVVIERDVMAIGQAKLPSARQRLRVSTATAAELGANLAERETMKAIVLAPLEIAASVNRLMKLPAGR